jgi:hypothetical protein
VTVHSAGCSCGCCEPSAPLTPELVWNRLGLDRIDYRVGTFASFRQAMIERSSKQAALRNWTTRSRDDYGIALLELWAYVADVLTFYGERIANESFIRTAGLRDSVVKLAALLGYRPAPGLAASTRLAFTLERERRLAIEPGLRVKSVPGPGEKAVTFETIEPVVASAALNALRVRGPLFDVHPFAAPSDGGAVEPPFADAAREAFTPDTSFLLFAEGAAAAEEKRVVSLRERGEVVDIRFEPPIQNVDIENAGGGTLMRFGRVFRLFGHDAPSSFIHYYTTTAGEIRFAEVAEGQTIPGTSPPRTYDFIVPAGPTLRLDRIVEGLDEGMEVLIVSRAAGFVGRRTVASTATVAARKGPLAASVTEVTFTSAVFSGSPRPNLRGIEVYELRQPEITLWQLDYPDRISGTKVLVAVGQEPLFRPGRMLFLTDAQGPAQAVRVLAATPLTVYSGGPPDHLAIDFTPGLDRDLDAETAVMLGNVAKATHGETVKRERLGSGNATIPFQAFRLSKSPLTHVPKPGAPHGAAAELEVRVGGLLWEQVESFFGRLPDDHVYVADLNDEQKTTVRFGDGVAGSRLKTGSEVIARYREGLGRAGLVRRDALTSLLDRPLGLKSATNPLDAEGAAEPEPLEEARANAPASVRTLGRIVSLRDFEDGARESALVAKAHAVWQWVGNEQAVRLTVAGEDGAHLDTLLGDLLADLDARRDPNRRVELVDYTSVLLQVEAIVVAHEPDRLASDLSTAVRQALTKLFTFENRDFGQPVHASDVLAAAQSAPGVIGVDLEALQFKDNAVRVAHGAPVDAVLRHVPIGADELATLAPGDLKVSTL